MAILRTYLLVLLASVFCLTVPGIAANADESIRIALDELPWQLHFIDGEPRGSKGKADGTELPANFAKNEGWSPIRVGIGWEEPGHVREGVAWYRTRFTVPASWQGQSLVLNLGRPDDGAEAFLNGKRLGAVMRFGDLLRFRLKPDDVRIGEDNLLAVRVWNWYQSGGLNAGDFSLERYGPAVQRTPDSTLASLPLKLTDSLNDDIMKTPGFSWGWRDAGTSDTRPKLSPARGALDGKDALAMRIDRTGSTEFFDIMLPADRSGVVWRRMQAVALRFWIRSDDTEGEIQIRLNQGRYRWGGGGQQSYLRRISFKGAAGWQQVTVPLAAFKRMVRDAQFEPLVNAGLIDNISIGCGNNELHRPGTILLGGFEVVPAGIAPSAAPIDLAGLWKFNRDNTRPDGSPSVFDEKDPKSARDRMGYGAEAGWAAPGFDAKSWADVSLPGTLWSQGFTYHGPSWFRREVIVPASWLGETLRLDMGKSGDTADVFFNGASVIKSEKAGELLAVDLPADKVRAGQPNVIAVRATDWRGTGGLIGPPSLKLKTAELGIKSTGGKSVAPESFDMGTRPGAPIELTLKFNGKLTTAADTQMTYQLIDCFYRQIAAGQAKPVRRADGSLGASIVLSPEQSRQLYYGEWFNLTATLCTSKGDMIAAEIWDDVKFKYADRDNLALPDLPAQPPEATPYGALKLVDVIDAAADPAADSHPYKEGGIRAGWVGRRAYSPWINGITVEQLDKRGYREVNNNQFFGYRVGRGKLKPHTAYLLRVLVPDNKRRYFVMDIQAGRNYKGTGYFNGSSSDDPNGNYPITGKYQWYDHLVMNDDVTYGSQGSRTVSSENGLWVFFHDNGRVYTGQYQAGPAVAEIRLYEVGPIGAHDPEIRYPANAPRRIMMMDWEREPEAPPADVACYARFMGFTHIAPTIQKWAFGGYWNNDLGFTPPSWHRVSREGERDEDIYDKWLAATKDTGILLVPRIEYGGGPNLPVSARVIGPNGKIDPTGRYVNFGANILAPETWEEFARVIDQVVVNPQQKYPQVAGMLWRQRQDRIKPSYGAADVEKFCRETGRTMPTGTPAEIAQWASKTVGDAYQEWWQIKRAEFIRKVRDRVKSHDPSLKLFYYPYDEDGWTLGPKNNENNTPQDWSDLYDVKTSGAFWQRRLAQLRAIPQQKFAEQIRTFAQPHMRFLPELFAKDADLYMFAPVCRQYLSNNADYVNYFRTGSGLSISHIYSYEEKGRNNVQGDRYESSEMTPGGSDFAMADEVQAFFHGDPVAITCTTYTYGRGWALEHRRFAQAFLALPAVPGSVVPQPSAGDDIRLRTYDAGGMRYVSIVNRGATERVIDVSVPGKGNIVDLVTGQAVPSQAGQGGIRLTVHLPPMSLNSFSVQP